jgi:hypothetical protein
VLSENKLGAFGTYLVCRERFIRPSIPHQGVDVNARFVREDARADYGFRLVDWLPGGFRYEPAEIRQPDRSYPAIQSAGNPNCHNTLL